MKKHPFIISDNSKNTQGFILLSEGIDFGHFNEVLLYDHGNQSVVGNIPIGLASDVVVKENGEIFYNASFDQDDEFAVKIEKKVEKKMIRCSSISVAPDLDSIYLNDEGVPVVARSRAREFSITPIGSNLNAIRLCDESTGLEMPVINLSATLKEFANLRNPQKTIMDKKTITGILNLSDDTDDTLVIARIKAGEEAIVKLADTKKKRFEEILSKSDAPQALKDKIVALTDDPDKLEELLKEVPKPVNLKDASGQAIVGVGKGEENWTFSDYSQKNPKKLAEIQKTNPTLYTELFRSQYGKEPATK